MFVLLTSDTYVCRHALLIYILLHTNVQQSTLLYLHDVSRLSPTLCRDDKPYSTKSQHSSMAVCSLSGRAVTLVRLGYRSKLDMYCIQLCSGLRPQGLLSQLMWLYDTCMLAQSTAVQSTQSLHSVQSNCMSLRQIMV